MLVNCIVGRLRSGRSWRRAAHNRAHANPLHALGALVSLPCQQFSFCGERLCAKHQPQRVVRRTAWYGAYVLRLVGTTQPRSGSK